MKLRATTTTGEGVQASLRDAPLRTQIPGIEMPGYCQLSLWDKGKAKLKLRSHHVSTSRWPIPSLPATTSEEIKLPQDIPGVFLLLLGFRQTGLPGVVELFLLELT